MPETRFTYADRMNWPADERYELIDGIAYDMSPAPSRRHQKIITALIIQFGLFLEDKPCEVYPAPFDVRLPKPSEDALTASTVVQPDLVVVCAPQKLDDRGCLGSPALIVEILSPETARKDLREKLYAYQQAGVPEYWIISPVEKTLMVFTPDAQGHYGSPAVYGSNEQTPVGVRRT